MFAETVPRPRVDVGCSQFMHFSSGCFWGPLGNGGGFFRLLGAVGEEGSVEGEGSEEGASGVIAYSFHLCRFLVRLVSHSLFVGFQPTASDSFLGG